ncbi:MAG TPA: hypothetical protein PLO85_06590 [Candidatus Omnitrophota bacterium]|mgnify:CR=1 FL=1|nr:hypothetical protein [Candidatus Omnitrophota bacterium]
MKTIIKIIIEDSYIKRASLVLILGILLFNLALKTGYLFSTKFLTFIAILVALFNQRFQDFINAPLINLDFDKNSDRCYRWAMLAEDLIQEWGVFQVERQYFRLKVTNNGLGTAKKVRITVELFNKDRNEEERFEPNSLRWLTREKEIDIASGETTYINLLSHVKKIRSTIKQSRPMANNFFVIRLELFDLLNARGLAWDKDKEIYYLKIIIHGDNVQAKTYWYKYIPDENDMFKPGNLFYIK